MNNEIGKLLVELYDLKNREEEIRNKLKELEDVFDDGIDYEILRIIKGCKITDNGLKDEHGNILSRDLYDWKIAGYFCNQKVGFWEDDYYGTIYYPVDEEGTFAKINYSCY